jgi:hypothetical protein
VVRGQYLEDKDRGQEAEEGILNIQYPTRNRRVEKFPFEIGHSVLDILRFKSF